MCAARGQGAQTPAQADALLDSRVAARKPRQLLNSLISLNRPTDSFSSWPQRLRMPWSVLVLVRSFASSWVHDLRNLEVTLWLQQLADRQLNVMGFRNLNSFIDIRVSCELLRT